MTQGVLTRQGHLTALAAELLASKTRTGLYPDDSAESECVARAELHAADCERCRAAVQVLVPELPLPALARPPRRRDLGRVVRPVLATAAALVLVFLSQKPAVPPVDAVLVKGGALYFETRTEDGRALVDGYRVAPGDRIAFALRTDGPVTLWLWERDADGQSTLISPPEGMALDPASQARTLPFAFELDDTGHEERFIAAACPRAATPNARAQPCSVRVVVLAKDVRAP